MHSQASLQLCNPWFTKLLLTQFTLHIQIIWSAHLPLAKTGDLYTVSCKSCGRPGNYEGDKSAIPLCEWSKWWMTSPHVVEVTLLWSAILYLGGQGKWWWQFGRQERAQTLPPLLPAAVSRGSHPWLHPCHYSITATENCMCNYIQSFRRLSWILYNSWHVYQQSFFNSLLYWEPWTPVATTLELPAVKNQECMDVTSTCWNFKCIDLHFHRVVWRLCRLWTLAIEVMRDCSLAGSWQLQTQNLSQGLPHPQSFNLFENNNCSRLCLSDTIHGISLRLHSHA